MRPATSGLAALLIAALFPLPTGEVHAQAGVRGSHHSLLVDRFDGPDRLITDEFSYWNPRHPKSVWSPLWQMTSGALSVRDGTGWSDSPIFRLTSRHADFSNVAVSFSLLNEGLGSTRRTPKTDWDGLHVWLRFKSERRLYYASVNRRDNTVVIKKKTPGGPSNDGTYYPLTPQVPFPVPYKQWQTVRATVRDNADGSVTIELSIDGKKLLTAIDKGTGGPPLRGPGRIGLRGDNVEFRITDLNVTPLGAPPSGYIGKR